jgi:predicted RNA methylase
MNAVDCLPGLELEQRTAAPRACQFFPTPPDAVDAIIPQVLRWWHDDRTIVELGAGDGHILTRLLAAGVKRERITAVELRAECEPRLRPLAGRVVIGDALSWGDRSIGRCADIVICNPPYGDMLSWAEAMLRAMKPCGECWLLGLLSFMGSASRAQFHIQQAPDAYVMTWRPDFTGGGGNPRDHAWFRFPGYSRWQPLSRRPLLGVS